jgi:hypothetical protein
MSDSDMAPSEMLADTLGDYSTGPDPDKDLPGSQTGFTGVGDAGRAVVR